MGDFAKSKRQIMKEGGREGGSGGKERESYTSALETE